MNNGTYNSSGDPYFMDCINLSKLIEPDFSGNFFTWRGGNPFSIHSKIDRVFVNSLWLDKFNNFGINFGYHSISDHTPISIMLQIQNIRKRKIPFKYKNSWHTYSDYNTVIVEAMDTTPSGNPLFKLLCKIKRVKSYLKNWSSTKPSMQLMINNLKDHNNNIYNQLVSNPMNDNLLQVYSTGCDALHEMMRKIAMDNEQKMKINWLQKGYRPTEFFFSKISEFKPCRRTNFSINSQGIWTSASEKLAQEAVIYFSDLFQLPQAYNQFPTITCKKVLSENAKTNLCKPFSME